MLTSAPIEWLWALAAASTVLSSCLLGAWIPLRRFRIAFPIIMVIGGAVLIPVCALRGISLAPALVLYSCAHIGLTLGVLPQRKLFLAVADRWRRGEEPQPVHIPARHLVFFAVSVVGVALAGFALTR